MNDSVPTRRIVGYVVIVSVLLVFYGLLLNHTSSGTLLSAGSEAPPISALGWLNGGPPLSDQLEGNVVVIDSFASW